MNCFVASALSIKALRLVSLAAVWRWVLLIGIGVSPAAQGAEVSVRLESENRPLFSSVSLRPTTELALARQAVSDIRPVDSAGRLVKKTPARSETPGLRIRPRQARDFFDSLGLTPSAKRVDRALSEIDTSLRQQAVALGGTWRKWTAAVSPEAEVDAAEVENPDPFEAMNRLSFDFNTGLQEKVLDPVVDFYLENTTVPVRKGVRNFFNNIHEPLTIASYALEGNIAGAGNATARFAINTTVGLVGIYDRAAEFGYPRQPRNLEVTACVYGVSAGPYVVLPVLGSATVRDAVVRLTTMAIYMEAMGLPVFVPYRGSSLAVQYEQVRDKQEFLTSFSMDPYATYRDLYLRMRETGCGLVSDSEQVFPR
ncbi:MAG: VacJ family lipoprotein [Rhodospirillales bacterium]|nr:VacJ family lipoprotein [Rhodospirillales bacterium]